MLIILLTLCYNPVKNSNLETFSNCEWMICMICVNCNVLDKSNTKFDDQGHQEMLTIDACSATKACLYDIRVFFLKEKKKV